MMTIFTTLAACIMGGLSWLMVKRYERHLDRQMGPWIAAELKVVPRRDIGRSRLR